MSLKTVAFGNPTSSSVSLSDMFASPVRSWIWSTIAAYWVYVCLIWMMRDREATKDRVDPS
jgi:hypothetical protein